ncbi:MAG: hypothetical protein LBQ79_05230, partial [Deltaproteobacteria bacterium]|nr:hypothetical protein [Deltaproteobacteria bacterium]
RALADYSTGPKTATRDKAMAEEWEFRRRAAASAAAGAVEGLKESYGSHGGACPWPDAAPAAGEGKDGDWQKDRAGELSFAEETLARLAGKTGAGKTAHPPVRTFGDGMYPGRLPEAGTDPCPSSGELRERLAEAERPGGPGRGSREALVLTSLLGSELADTGGWEARKEARSLMKAASAGLDKLAGARDPDALAAKERLARGLAGLQGFGTVLPVNPVKPARDHLLEAKDLFRELEELAPKGLMGEEIRNRARLDAEGVAFLLDGSANPEPMELMMSGAFVHLKDSSGLPSLNAARGGFDMSEFLLPTGIYLMCNLFQTHALAVRRHLLGARHPETASSLARCADLLTHSDNSERTFAFWALALEALEGKGGRHDPARADLESRIGVQLLFGGEGHKAAPFLRRSEELFRRVRGETSQEALESGLYLAQALYWSMDVKGADAEYRRIAGLLDGKPPRKNQNPARSSDAAVLSVALAGLGATTIFLGDRPAGEELLKRSAKLRAKAGDGAPVTGMGDMYRSIFIDMANQIRAARGMKPGDKDEEGDGSYEMVIIGGIGDGDDEL